MKSDDATWSVLATHKGFDLDTVPGHIYILNWKKGKEKKDRKIEKREKEWKKEKKKEGGREDRRKERKIALTRYNGMNTYPAIPQFLQWGLNPQQEGIW